MREYWRGSAEAWECDEMGHMNVRYWVRHCLDGVPALAEDIGCGGAFAKGATATLVPIRQHIKFMREARAGAPLFSRGGIVSVTSSEITFYCEIIHTFTGEIGATFITTLAHIDAKSGKAFGFPARVAALSEKFKIEIPVHGQPRSISLDGALTIGNVETAISLGCRFVGLAGVRTDEVDLFNRLYPEGMIGRVSNAMPRITIGCAEMTPEAE